MRALTSAALLAVASVGWRETSKVVQSDSCWADSKADSMGKRLVEQTAVSTAATTADTMDAM